MSKIKQLSIAVALLGIFTAYPKDIEAIDKSVSSQFGSNKFATGWPATDKSAKVKVYKKHLSYNETKSDVNLKVKTSKKKLLNNEYQPINIAFTNTTNKTYVLKGENIGLKLLNKNELDSIATKRYSYLPFTVIASAQVFTFGQLIAQTLSSAHMAISVPIILLGTLFTTSLEQYRIKRINKREKQVFKELKNGIVVEPYTKRKLTLYIHKNNVKHRFDIKLLEEDFQTAIKFKVDLNQVTGHQVTSHQVTSSQESQKIIDKK